VGRGTGHSGGSRGHLVRADRVKAGGVGEHLGSPVPQAEPSAKAKCAGEGRVGVQRARTVQHFTLRMPAAILGEISIQAASVM
jgi:hypothetical protein